MNNRSDKPSGFKGLRDRLGSASNRTPNSQRRISRRDQEARQQRIFLLSVGIAGLVVILILAGGLTYEYVIKPNQVIANVNGQEIKRRDYWKYQSVVLYQQARLYESYASQSTGQQQSQFLGFASSLDAQRANVWGSTDVSDTTVQQMIENQLYLDGADEMNIQLPDDEVERYALNAFSPADAPLVTPVPTPTMIPERAEAATKTAEALQGSPVAGTPEINATPVVTQGSPAASPIVTGTPEGMSDPTSAADAGFTNFENQVFDKAHMTKDDYYRLFAKPQLAREKIDAQVQSAVPQKEDQVHLEHILVATEDLANQLSEQANGGADFSQLARSNSTDTLTAPTGGDLGWVTRSELDPATADVAFALQPNQVSAPIQTPYGWELIRLAERQDGRPLSDAQFEEARQNAVDAWLADQRTKSSIKTDYEEAPTPTPDAFQPPVGAPTVPPATPVPQATPIPAPILGPDFVPIDATPIAPDTSPQASPAGATPAGSPVIDATAAA